MRSTETLAERLAERSKKLAFWSRRTVDVFQRNFCQKDGQVWTLELRAILLQELGEFFYPSLIGDLLSPEHRTSKKQNFCSEKCTSGVGFCSWKLTFPLQNVVEWNGSKITKKSIFELFWEEPLWRKSREIEEKCGLSSHNRMQFPRKARLNLSFFS